MSAGLLLVLAVDIGRFPDRLAERNRRLLKRDFYLVLIQQLAGRNLKLLVTDPVEKRLVILRIVDNTERLIFLRKLREPLRGLVLLALCQSHIFLIGVRSRDFELTILNRVCLGGNAVTGVDIQLGERTDVPRHQLGYLGRLAALKHIELAGAEFILILRIEQHIVRAKRS